MSNAWSYTLKLLSPTNPDIIIEDALRICGAAGSFGQRNNGVENFYVMGSDGEDHVFQSRDDAFAHMNAKGGFLQLWKGESLDFGITVDKRPEMYTLSISVDSVYFKYPPDNQRYETYIANIFRQFCQHFQPRYAFSLDEHMLNIFPDKYDAVDNYVMSSTSPALIFWINYFTSDYMARINKKRLLDLGGSIATESHGSYVSFFDGPSSLDLEKWRAINEAWLSS